MQDRYVGDVGDYAKYGLLRALAGPDLRLGVVWWLKAEPDSDVDGRFLEYLDPAHKTRLHLCDPELHKLLRAVLFEKQQRSVVAIADSGVLPTGTVFCADAVPTSRRDREAWNRTALAATAGADLVFHDPDNGLALSIPRGRRGPKCVTPEELRPYLGRGQSVIVYHHQTREAPLAQQVANWFRELQRLQPAEMWALSFHRSSVRAFFVVAAEDHRDVLRERTDAFIQSAWGTGRSPHFRLHRPAGSI